MNYYEKTSLTILIVFIGTTISAQNPFAKLGYDAPTATASKGEFEEFHDLEDIVEIGSVKYNVRTKKNCRSC